MFKVIGLIYERKINKKGFNTAGYLCVYSTFTEKQRNITSKGSHVTNDKVSRTIHLLKKL